MGRALVRILLAMSSSRTRLHAQRRLEPWRYTLPLHEMLLLKMSTWSSDVSSPNAHPPIYAQPTAKCSLVLGLLLLKQPQPLLMLLLLLRRGHPRELLLSAVKAVRREHTHQRLRALTLLTLLLRLKLLLRHLLLLRLMHRRRSHPRRPVGEHPSLLPSNSS